MLTILDSLVHHLDAVIVELMLSGGACSAEIHQRGKRLAWPGHKLKGELKKMHEL